MAIDWDAKIEALQNAITSGELTISSDGESITYRSMADLERALDIARREKNSQSSTKRAAFGMRRGIVVGP